MMRWLLSLLVAITMAAEGHAQCRCADAAASSSNEQPFVSLVAADHHRAVSLCGSIKETLGKAFWKVSDLEVIDCSTNEELLVVGPFYDCAVTKHNDNSLVIDKMLLIPVGKNWAFEDALIENYTIRINRDGAPAISESFVFVPPAYSAQEAAEILRRYHQAVENRKPGDDLDPITGALALLAMSGSSEGQATFERAGEELKLDGCYGEYYSELKDIYERHFKKKQA